MTGERLSLGELEALGSAALRKAGASEVNAGSVVQALVAAEVIGQKGHGLSRLPGYAAQLRSGKVVGDAVPSAKRLRPAALAIDAAHGFAFPALDLAIAELPIMAKDFGIAAAGIRRSHHAGALGLVAERIAQSGAVALVLANSPAAMAPWGGRRALFGTNPIAFAAPRAGQPPLVIDLALSEVARAKIVGAAKSGDSIPLGWATDRHGALTTNPAEALDGSLLPAGGAKGAALALMVELLAAAVTGALFASEASSFLDDKGSPPATGQLLIALDGQYLGAGSGMAERIAALAAEIENEPGARVPGARRATLRDDAQRNGVAVDAGTLAEVRALAGRSA